MSVTFNEYITVLTTSFFFHHCLLATPTAGFAGDDAPRSVFPSLIGRARQPGIMVRRLLLNLLRE